MKTLDLVVKTASEKTKFWEQFQTKHSLPFEAAPWKYSHISDRAWESTAKFRVGTVNGLFRTDTKNNSCIIIMIINEQPGNGHVDDTFQWFEASCKMEGCDLIVAEIWNKKFHQSLLNKRGFSPYPSPEHIKSSWVIKKHKDIQ